jgi:oligopeptide transport system substrate-binding protein
MSSRFFFRTLFILACCFSCTHQTTNNHQQVAKGGKAYGGEIRFGIPEPVNYLFPCSSEDIYTQRINTQIFEPLLKWDYTTMKVVPSLAASYQLNKSGNEITLKLRPGVVFHNDRGLNASDVKFTLEMACSGLSINKSGHLLVDLISGAADFHLHSTKSLPSKGIKGIQILDSLTLRIKLNRRYIGFEKLLTHPNLGIISKKAFEQYGMGIVNHPIGTGPFKLDQLTEKGVRLVRNQSYWRQDKVGNQLPFISKIKIAYIVNKQLEIIAFRKNKLDFVFNIPVSEIDQVLGSFDDAKAGKNLKHRVLSTKSYRISCLAFNCEKKPFDNPMVRRAFSIAIDKNDLIDTWLSGEGWPASFSENWNNDHEKIDFNPSEARLLLKKAGFADGKGFAVLQLYAAVNKGSLQHKLCLGIAEQLKKNLNIILKLNLCNRKTLDKNISQGLVSVWKSDWMADYPTKEEFLTRFYNGNLLQNRVKNGWNYHTVRFDQLYTLIMKEQNEGIRKSYYDECFQLLSNDSPIIPILHDDFIVMVNARIRNFKINPMENLDFSSIFIHESQR